MFGSSPSFVEIRLVANSFVSNVWECNTETGEKQDSRSPKNILLLLKKNCLNKILVEGHKRTICAKLFSNLRTNVKEDHPRIIPVKFGEIPSSSFGDVA